MAEKQKTKKEEVERIYTVPLRNKCLTVPWYKKAKKATKVLKEFLAKNMKVENRDIKKVKLADEVNRALWSRGITNPPYKITVKAIKKDGIVSVQFVSLPNKYKSENIKLKKLIEKKEKKKEEKQKKSVKKEEIKQEPSEKKIEKEKTSSEAKPERKVKKV